MIKYKSFGILELTKKYSQIDFFNEDLAYIESLPLEGLIESTIPIYVNAFSYLIVETGTAEITINEIRYSLRPNDIAILSPSHLLKINGMALGTKYRLLFINELLYGQVTFRNKLYYQFLLYKNPIIQFEGGEASTIIQSIDTIVQRMRAKNHNFQKAAIQVATFGFLLELSNIIRNKEMIVNMHGSKSDNVFRLFAGLVMRNFKKEHNIAFYAKEMNMSQQNLSLIVKRVTGNSASNFIYERLYHEARLLLHHPGLTIQQIAEELHFSDQSSFGKFFKSNSGESPIQFRNRHLA